MRPLSIVATLLVASLAHADEGMWLLNQPPKAHLQQAYGFSPTAEWMTHVQRSCVRFETGGSGSIVSAEGLVMTNHHVGSDMIEKLSTPQRNLLETGFHAATRDKELKCPDLEVRVLWTIEDVTAKVNAAVKPEMSAADAQAERRKATARIEKEAQDKTGMTAEVVTLWHGARYHLYQYRAYTDVRLVFAPESAIAFFGGDNDNFEFPRYDLDCCFFRIYENDKPLKPEHFLTWSDAGTKEGELALVFGHPGRTQRLFTTDHLRFLRDVDYPHSMERLYRGEVRWTVYGGRSEEHARQAQGQIFGIANSRKAIGGILEGLRDPALMNAKQAEEQALRSAVAANPDWTKQWGDGWGAVAAAQQTHRGILRTHGVLERGRGMPQMLRTARHLVRMAEEAKKPNEERLAEYTDAERESLELELFSPAPIYPEMEIEGLTGWLGACVETFGGDDALVQSMLKGKGPAEAAATMIRGSKLAEVESRKALAKGGAAAIESSKDPLIALAKLIDAPARSLRKQYEDDVESLEREGYAKIASAGFAVNGENQYPDATFTLRMAFGPVKGYDQAGSHIEPYTTLGGTFDLMTARKGKDPYRLTEKWLTRKDKLDLSTPYNFVCTADIIGGNSGSPVVNTQGEVVGLIFDGNIHSLIWDIAYSDVQGRAVAVDSRGIIECLTKIYDAPELVKEIRGE